VHWGLGRGTGRPPMPLRDRRVSVRPPRPGSIYSPAPPQHARWPPSVPSPTSSVAHCQPKLENPYEQHPYPLTPGTPAVGSRECWDCGQQDHRQRAPVCASGTVLSEPECDWRRIAGFIVSTFNRERLTAGPQDVNYVSYSQYTPYPNYAHY